MRRNRQIKHSYQPLFIVLLLAFFLGSCSKEPIRETPIEPTPDDTTTTPVTYSKGIFVINEGNFNWGNASVSYIDEATNSVIPDIYKKVNQNVLGDVAQSMTRFKDYGLIVVNNSNRIEVVTLKDFKSYTTISGFYLPRYLELIDSTKAYVTSLKKNIAVIDLTTFTITKEIPTPNWTEVLARYDHFMFVTSVGDFSQSNEQRKAQIFIIDTRTDLIVDSITTGKEPLGIVIDKKQKIWVLCTGGYDQFEAPSLIRIDPLLRIVEKTFTFPKDGNLPKKLCINSTQDTIYFIKTGVYQMAVTADGIPSQPYIPSNGRVFYGLAIHPDGSVFVSDVLDYVQDGKVYRYNSSKGTLLNTYEVGRIPASFCFPN